MRSQTRSHAAAVAALTLVMSGGLAAGCGGDGGDPAAAFLGTWYQVSADPTSSTTGFTIRCDDANFAFLATNPMFLVFPTLQFERGVLTDVVETSGNCSPLDYDISGNALTLPVPDPRIMDDPGCAIPFSLPDPTMAGRSVQAFFVLLPQPGWEFTLLAEKAANGTQQAKLAGTALGHVIVFDGDPPTESNPDCSIGGMDTYERLTRP